MRYAYVLLLFIFCGASFLVGSVPTLKMDVQGVSTNYSVGDQPLVRIKITNQSKHMVYIDYNDFKISSSVAYEVGLNKVPVMISGARYPSTDGTGPKNNHLGPNTLGIMPGQSLVRIYRVEKLEKQGNARIHISLNVFLNVDLSIFDKEWTEAQLSNSCPIKVVASK